MRCQRTSALFPYTTLFRSGEMLADIDLLLVDLQDVGARYYTFIWTMYLCMRACEKAGVHVLVLDRPNPINGITTEGPALDPRSEEHTSELQSLRHLVCRLL